MQEKATESSPVSKASWSSVLGGVVTVLAASLLLSALAMALGDASIKADSLGTLTVSTTFGVWSVITLLASFSLGGFVAGKLARKNGSTHGFLVWASALTGGILLGNLAISSALSAATDVIRYALSENAEERVITISSLGEKGSGLINRIANDLNVSMGFDFEVSGSRNTARLLRATDIPVMQPGFIESQMVNAREDALRAVEALRTSPDKYAAILSGLIARLDQRVSVIGEDIDQENAIAGLIRNTGMSEDQARVNLIRLLAEHQQAANLARDILGVAEGRLRAAQLEIDDLLHDVRDEANALSRLLTRSALAAFFTLLLGAILCSYAGYLGTIWRFSWLEKNKIVISEEDLS